MMEVNDVRLELLQQAPESTFERGIDVLRPHGVAAPPSAGAPVSDDPDRFDRIAVESSSGILFRGRRIAGHDYHRVSVPLQRKRDAMHERLRSPAEVGEKDTRGQKD